MLPTQLCAEINLEKNFVLLATYYSRQYIHLVYGIGICIGIKQHANYTHMSIVTGSM